MQKKFGDEIKKIDKLIKMKKYLEAGILASRILSTQPNNKKIVKLVGLIKPNLPNITAVENDQLINFFNANQFREALTKIENLKREYPLCWILLNYEGVFHLQLQEFEPAINSLTLSLRIKPSFIPSKINLSLCNKNIGKLDIAASILEDIIKKNPNVAQAQNNLGDIYIMKREFERAVSCLNVAIEQDPNYVEAYNNLGLAFFHLNKFESALLYIRKALKLRPNYVDALSNLGNVQNKLGQFDEAEVSYKNALEISPNNVEIIYNLAVNYSDQELYPQSLNYYEKAISIDKFFIKAYSNICSICEKNNELDRVLSTITRAISVFVELPVDLRLHQAQLLFRNGELQSAVNILQNLNIENLASDNKPSHYELLAKCYEKLGNFELAFINFSNMNLETKKTAAYHRLSKSNFISRIKNLNNDIVNLDLIDYSDPDLYNLSNDLTFIIGFPRSGTTLLDSILRASKQTFVIEEKPFITQAVELIGRPKTLEQIKKLSSDDLANARDFYLQKISALDGYAKNLKVIDKLPLNISEIPFILRCFPNAKFITALRHPLDCIFSSWAQNFKLNEAMINMLDLETTSILYNEVMSLYKVYKEKFPDQFFEIRYEDLVAEFDSETTLLADFIGIPWDQDFRKFHEVAIKRSRINTPSYSQVTKPLYSNSVSRYIRFRSYLSHIMPIVKPWLIHFNYDH